MDADPPIRRDNSVTCDVKIFTLGGTIDKDYPKLTSGYAFEFGDQSAAERIMKNHPNLGVSFSIESVCKKDSLEITHNDRVELLRAIKHYQEDVKRLDDEEISRFDDHFCMRIVVTHGTDTMIETAMYIKDKLNEGHRMGDIPFVVAFTGATKPERFVDSDASFNLGFAVAATAGFFPSGSVMICMNGNVIPVEECVRDEESGLFKKVGKSGIYHLPVSYRTYITR